MDDKRVLPPISPTGFAPGPVWGPTAGGWAPRLASPAGKWILQSTVEGGEKEQTDYSSGWGRFSSLRNSARRAEMRSCARPTRTPERDGSAWSVIVLAESGTPDQSYFQIGGAPSRAHVGMSRAVGAQLGHSLRNKVIESPFSEENEQAWKDHRRMNSSRHGH